MPGCGAAGQAVLQAPHSRAAGLRAALWPQQCSRLPQARSGRPGRAVAPSGAPGSLKPAAARTAALWPQQCSRLPQRRCGAVSRAVAPAVPPAPTAALRGCEPRCGPNSAPGSLSGAVAQPLKPRIRQRVRRPVRPRILTPCSRRCMARCTESGNVVPPPRARTRRAAPGPVKPRSQPAPSARPRKPTSRASRHTHRGHRMVGQEAIGLSYEHDDIHLLRHRPPMSTPRVPPAAQH